MSNSGPDPLSSRRVPKVTPSQNPRSAAGKAACAVTEPAASVVAGDPVTDSGSGL